MFDPQEMGGVIRHLIKDSHLLSVILAQRLCFEGDRRDIDPLGQSDAASNLEDTKRTCQLPKASSMATAAFPEQG